MSLWSKILAGAIVVVTLAFLYLASNTLKAKQEWLKLVGDYQTKIADLHAKNETLREGGANLRTRAVSIDNGIPPGNPADPGDQPGVRQYLSLLDQQVARLGRGIWMNCQVSSSDPAAGTVQLTIDRPNPHRLEPNMPVYAFDQRPVAEGGAYIGLFKVAEAAETTVTLAPLRLTQRLAQKLSNAQGEWTLFENLPPDDHALFARMDEAELRSLIPEAARNEYLRDGKEAQASDPPEHVVDGKYVRPLRDYAQILLDAQIRSAKQIDRAVAVQNDLAAMTKAVENSDARLATFDGQIARYTAELERVKKEDETVSQHLAALEKRLAELRAANERLLAENKRLADEYAAKQREALRAAPSVGSL